MLITLGIILLIANAIAHLVQSMRLRQEGAAANQTMGVLAFVVINGIVALLLIFNQNWARYLALVFPLLGGTALALTFRQSGGSRTLSIVILLLDVALILIFSYLFIVRLSS